MSEANIASTSGSAVGSAGVERLSTQVIWAYSIPRIGIMMMGILFTTYLMKFSTDVLLIAPAAMGGLIAASRLWDAISDPLAGYLSDNTRSKHGRRRVWLYYSAIPVAIGMIMMWSPPDSLDGVYMIIWMGVALLVYETASTAFFVPHGALGIELTPNYHERTRLFGYVHMIGAIGSIFGLIALQGMNMAEDKRLYALILSLFAGFFVASLIIGSTRMLPERVDFQGRGGVNVFRSFGDIFKNIHARLLLIMYAIETFGAASVGLLVPYLVEYVVPMKEYMVPLLVMYIVPQFAFTPLWIFVSRRIGKKRLWAYGMWGTAFCFITGFFIITPGEWSTLLWPGAFLLGCAGGIAAVIAPAIKADIVDYDEYLTEERKEGAYYAVWNFIRKGAGSLTALVTGLVLQFSGFVPNVEQTLETQYYILGLFTLLPGSCYVIGALIFMRFSLNEKEHGDLRRILDERNA